MRTEITDRAGMEFQSMKMKLNRNQVLIPKFEAIHAPAELGEGRYGGAIIGSKVVGWEVKNIKKIDLGQIDNVMTYGPEQLTESKLNRLISREEQLRAKIKKWEMPYYPDEPYNF